MLHTEDNPSTSSIQNSTETETKIPVASEVNNHNQPPLSERKVKSIFSFSTVYNVLKSCVVAIVSAVIYILDKINSFFMYIFSKLRPQAKQNQEIPPSNNSEHVATTADITPPSSNNEHVATTEDITPPSSNNEHVATTEDITPPSSNNEHVATTADVTKLKVFENIGFFEVLNEQPVSDEHYVAEETLISEVFITSEDAYQDNKSSKKDGEEVAEHGSSQEDLTSNSSNNNKEPSSLVVDKEDNPQLVSDDEHNSSQDGLPSNKSATKEALSDEDHQSEEQPASYIENAPNQKDEHVLGEGLDSFVVVDNSESDKKQNNTEKDNQSEEQPANTPILDNTDDSNIDESDPNGFVVVENHLNSEKPDDKLLANNTSLGATQENTSTKTQKGTWFSTIKDMLSPISQLLEKSHECFDNFFKISQSDKIDINIVRTMSSYSREDFDTIFLEKVSYYLQNETSIELKPCNLINFIKDQITFIQRIEKAAKTEPVEVQEVVEKCRRMMEGALYNYTALQIKDITDDKRFFTAVDVSMYIPSDKIIQITKNSEQPTENVNHQFISDISRYDTKIKFFDNDTLLWDSSDLKAVELVKKIRTCTLELSNITKHHTQEYSDKSSELEEISDEVIQYYRSKIQSFLNSDPKIVDLLLLEQTQASFAIPLALYNKYCEEKLNDVFGGEEKENRVISKDDDDRECKIEFHKKQGNKIVVKAILYANMQFFVDGQLFDDLYSYQVITELEYNFNNSDKNCVISGELELYPYKKS
jgi:hypothetical protein